MNKAIAFLAVAFALAAAPLGATGVSEAYLAKYPSDGVYRGHSATVDLNSHKQARTFRTRLRAAARGKANFAGHMILTSWGCGTMCQQNALIDARTGKVSFGPSSAVGTLYRADSRLLIVNPIEEIKQAFGANPPDYVKTSYYLWKGGKLVKIAQP